MNIWEQSFENLRRPHLEEKKGDGNLANNYPPYDKVTRGDVIAGATGKDQMGGKKKKMKSEERKLGGGMKPGGGYDRGYKAMQKEIEKLESGKEPATAKRYKEMRKEHSNWRSDFEILDEEGCEPDNSIKPKKGIKNKITINPNLKTEEISEREMTSGEMKKEKELKNKYDPSGMKASMKKQYGTEKGKEVYFATIRKKAMEQYPDLIEKKDDTYLELDREKRQRNNEKAIADMKKTKANRDMVKAASKHFEEHQLDEVLDTPEKANEYGKKALGSMLGAAAKTVITKDKTHIKTIDKRIKGAEMAKKKAERKAAEETRKEELELDYYLDEALRPASERMKSMQTASGRKTQEQERTKKSKLEAEADKILAGFSNKGSGTSKTKASPKSAAPEANRSLKTGQKKDTLAMKVNKAMNERREMDEPGESDSNSDVKKHNRVVGYKSKTKRPSIENDPRYGTVQDKSGKYKY